MNKKQWLGLLLLYLGYLLMGATMFFFIESDFEQVRRFKLYTDFRVVSDIIINKSHLNHEDIFVLEEYFGKNFSETNQDVIAPAVWDFYNSFFFVVTVVSTIGYGNLSPTQAVTRILMIIYAVIGIPLNGILLTSLGQFFSAVFVNAHKEYKSKNHHQCYSGRWGLTLEILTYLMPGLIIFIFLPSGVFMYFENWTFDQSVYYAFVTLTTIGFGDIVAGQKPMTEYDASITYLYKIMLIFWIIFGLGYLVMLLGFVTRGLYSKKIIRLEKKLLTALTHSKLWHNIEKDMGYLRRIINEINLDKVKPVFRDEVEGMPKYQNLYRSKSLPIIKVEEPRTRWRQRANSEYAAQKISMVRIFSESDLQRIDKKATFAAVRDLPSTAEIMLQAIAIEQGKQSESAEDQGIHIFSDHEVLASETSTIQGSEKPENKPRNRTQSESPQAGLDSYASSPNLKSNGVDWTWSGASANAIQEAINKRYKERLLTGLERPHKANRRSSVHTAKYGRNSDLELQVNTNPDPSVVQTKRENNKISFLNVPQVEVKRHSLQEHSLFVSPIETHYMTHTVGIKPETSLFKKLKEKSPSVERDVLEETSVADFLRVLKNLHTTIGERLIADPPLPKRKLGTASLTPPTLRALLELFPEEPPSPKQPKRRKGSLLPNFLNIKRTDSKSEIDVKRATDLENGDDPEKTGETSNLRRLGRFLLRSYPNAPKTEAKQRKFSEVGEEIPTINVTTDNDTGTFIITVDPAETPATTDSNDSVFFKP